MGESSRPREPGFRGLKTSSIDKATLVRGALAQTKWRNRGRPRLTETFFLKERRRNAANTSERQAALNLVLR